MIIIGAKGFAKEVLEVLHQLNQAHDVVFFDDVSTDLPTHLYGTFPILKSLNEAEEHFKNNNVFFTLGIGNPQLRNQLQNKFLQIGGVLKSTISPFAHVGHYNTIIEEGCSIMAGAVITNDIKINKGCLINLNCTIGHDSILEQFIELSPGVHVSGNCKIGEFTNIGTNATILPKINIGKNVIIAAGAVVTSDVPDYTMVAGVPAVIKKQLPKINI
jgi:sugar O-acyltransferase (sialic acid O-acetyltransferase NeuD family)